MEERKLILCSHFILGGHFLLKCDSQCKTTVWFELLWRTWTLGLAFSLSADIIQPKHLPSALLYLSIVLFWLLSHLCLLYCSESEIDHSHLSFTSINVVQFYRESHWAYQHQFVPEGTCSLGVCCCGGVQVRDAWPGGYSAMWWPVTRWRSPSRRDSQGMINSHDDWNDRDVMFSSHPSPTSSFQFPLDHHDGSNKVEASREGRKKILKFLPHINSNSSQFSRSQRVAKIFNLRNRGRRRWNALI